MKQVCNITRTLTERESNLIVGKQNLSKHYEIEKECSNSFNNKVTLLNYWIDDKEEFEHNIFYDPDELMLGVMLPYQDIVTIRYTQKDNKLNSITIKHQKDTLFNQLTFRN